MLTENFFHKEWFGLKNAFLFMICLGANPQQMNQSKVKCPLMETIDPKKWGMKFVSEDEENFVVTFEVNIPATALVGK